MTEVKEPLRRPSASTVADTASPPHILIVGGGYVGMYTALRLQKLLRRGEATVTVVDPQPNMTYQPFLAEAAAGSIEARHVVVPLRRVLRGCRVLTATVTAVDHDRWVVAVLNAQGEASELGYDRLVLAPGSVSRTLPVPGLAESGIGFTTVGEAIWLRNHVLSRLDTAAATAGAARRRRMLTFVVVGGGYSGVEIVAELQDMARHAMRRYPELSPERLRWVLVEAAERILPEVSASLADYTVARLRERGMEVALRTRVESMVDGHVELSDGQRFEADTVVWTAGVRANPLVARTGLPADVTGRLLCTAELRVEASTGCGAPGTAPRSGLGQVAGRIRPRLACCASPGPRWRCARSRGTGSQGCSTMLPGRLLRARVSGWSTEKETAMGYAVHNVHERVLPVPPEQVWAQLCRLGSSDDPVYPRAWGWVRFPEGIASGAPMIHNTGVATVHCVISEVEPGRKTVVRGCSRPRRRTRIPP